MYFGDYFPVDYVCLRLRHVLSRFANISLDLPFRFWSVAQINNVLAMSEMIAFFEMRFLIGYMGSRMQRMFNDLCSDIRYKNDVKHVFSNSYDLVQECALYLTEHYGKHLYDIIGYTKKGKKITVQIACIKRMTKLINRKWSDCYRSISVEDLTPNSEPSTEIQEEITQDYTVYDSIVEKLNLTDNMRTALECRMAGLHLFLCHFILLSEYP